MNEVREAATVNIPDDPGRGTSRLYLGAHEMSRCQFTLPLRRQFWLLMAIYKVLPGCPPPDLLALGPSRLAILEVHVDLI